MLAVGLSSPPSQLLAVAALHVAPERGVLHEGVAARGAQVGPLARVLPQVHAQRLGQREPPQALRALVRPLARVPPRVLRGRAPRGEAPPAARLRAAEGLDAAVRAQVHHQVVPHAEGRGALRAALDRIETLSV